MTGETLAGAGLSRSNREVTSRSTRHIIARKNPADDCHPGKPHLVPPALSHRPDSTDQHSMASPAATRNWRARTSPSAAPASPRWRGVEWPNAPIVGGRAAIDFGAVPTDAPITKPAGTIFRAKPGERSSLPRYRRPRSDRDVEAIIDESVQAGP